MDMEEVSIMEEMDGIIESVVEHPPDLESEELALRILKQAIDIEKLTKDHFEVLSKKVENDGGKTMFEYLSSEEAEHIKTLNIQYRSLKEDGKWLMREDVGPAERVCPLVAPEKKNIKDFEDIEPDDRRVSKDSTDLEALKLAIEVKKRALKFYCTAASKIDDGYGKKMFDRIIEMETKHLKELEVQYAWLDQAGFWYDPNMITD